MHLPIAATLFALFVLGFGAVRRLVSRPGASWARWALVEGFFVMVLTTLLSFSLGFAFNFVATRSEQTFGSLQLGWTLAAVAVAAVGGWLLHPARGGAGLEVVDRPSGGPRPPASKDGRPPRVPRAA